MRNATRNLLLLSMVVAATISLIGCTRSSGFYFNNSKFVYPNSNIEPLGHVSVSESWDGLFFPPRLGAEEINSVVNAALRQKGGDLLINYKMTVSVTTFPIIPIYITELIVEGTAAKMTIGRQEIK